MLRIMLIILYGAFAIYVMAYAIRVAWMAWSINRMKKRPMEKYQR